MLLLPLLGCCPPKALRWLGMGIQFAALVVGMVLIYGMMHGWFDELNGARPDTIKHVETVRYDPALFAEEGKSDDTKPAPECCVCNEAFDESREIKMTSCKHYFHEECLGKWLKVSTTCPLCRN